MTVGALLGHSITETKIEHLKGVENVILWPDPDPVGLKGMIKVAYKLKPVFNVVLPAQIPVRQADEMEPIEVLRVFKSLRPFSEALKCQYEFKALKRGNK